MKNDFGVSVQFPLARKSSLVLQADLPAGLPNGNYEKQLLIDGKLIPLRNFTETDVLLIVQNTSAPPRLVSLSDESQKYRTAYDYLLFKPLTTFKKGQNLVATIAIPNTGASGVDSTANTLKIRNTASGQESTLRQSGYFVDFIYSQLLFLIPESIPSGKYEVKFVAEQSKNPALISERYHRIITIL